MVIDTSALIAILFDEPERAAFVRAIEQDPVRLLSAGSALEATIVIARRAGPDAAADATDLLSDLVESLGAEIEPVTANQSRLGGIAYQEFGKGMHPAGLNFGDCFAYALARESGEPLLFKGNDFSRADIASALGDGP